MKLVIDIDEEETIILNCNSQEIIANVTPQPKTDILDKITAEIDNARFIDKDTKTCKNALASGLEVALRIIDKYKEESEVD